METLSLYTVIFFLLVAILTLSLWVRRLLININLHYSLEHELQYETEHDTLTGLANSYLFVDRLSQAMKNSVRSKQQIAVLYMDIDNFKSINTTYDSDTGDLVLQEVASRLKSSLRDSDTVSRLGGDEFMIILDHFNESVYIHSVVEKIMKLAQTPLSIEGKNITITASLGLAIYPDNSLDTKEILEHAASAMHIAKASGGNTSHYFSS